MNLPFSREQFFDVFGLYNSAIWPMQIALFASALGCLALLFLQRGFDRAPAWILAALWAWTGVAYHLVFFSRINPAARIFGGAFLLAAVLFAWHARKGTLRFARPSGASYVAGSLLIAYALVGYPLIGTLVGHSYPRTPTFGAPCPLTIFTIGMLLLAKPPVPAALFLVPLAWAFVGTSAVLQFGVLQDLGLPVAAAVALVVLVSRRRRRGAGERRHAQFAS